MNEYISYEDLKGYRGIDADTLDDDTLLRDFCTDASRDFEKLTRGRLFYPRLEARYFDYPEDDCTRLILDDDLLAVTTFTTNNTATTITSSNYYLMCGQSYNLQPYDRISLKVSGTQPNLLYSGTPQKSQVVTGTWGYHDDWANAWLDSNDTVQDSTGLTATAATLTVTDLNALDIYNVAPRFKVQQLLKIESEYVYITAKNSAKNTLTIRRGVNGTTAAIHAKGTTIYVYEPVEIVANAVKLLAAWFYAQKDNLADIERPIMTDGGQVIMPPGYPKRVIETARYYRK